MTRTARALIETSAGAIPKTLRYLVAAAMYGSLVSGRPAEARELWAQHGANIDLREDLLLKMLIARAGGAPRP
jgi:hypothetical protein